MHPVQNADGGSVLQTARNYPIDAATVIDAGAVVKLSGGKVVLAAAAALVFFAGQYTLCRWTRRSVFRCIPACAVVLLLLLAWLEVR